MWCSNSLVVVIVVSLHGTVPWWRLSHTHAHTNTQTNTRQQTKPAVDPCKQINQQDLKKPLKPTVSNVHRNQTAWVSMFAAHERNQSFRQQALRLCLNSEVHMFHQHVAYQLWAQPRSHYWSFHMFPLWPQLKTEWEMITVTVKSCWDK